VSQLHEIKGRIAGVNGTKKITRAMYLISASRSQKSKTQLNRTLPYFKQIRQTMAEILSASVTIYSPYIDRYDGNRKEKSRKNLYFVLMGDKGMAGGYNHNIISLIEDKIDKDSSDVLVAGYLGYSLVSRAGFHVDPEFRYPVMNPTLYRARDTAEIINRKFLTKQYDAVYLVFTEMASAIKQDAKIVQLLPLQRSDFTLAPNADSGAKEDINKYHIIKYEPDSHTVFDYLTAHYLKGVIYSAFVEAFTSEQHARMVAMDNATNSADETIARLEVRYNRARQAAITQEISEIVGGIPT
jgi:F-type H+-transporting ATPase subunit gamma